MKAQTPAYLSKMCTLIILVKHLPCFNAFIMLKALRRRVYDYSKSLTCFSEAAASAETRNAFHSCAKLGAAI